MLDLRDIAKKNRDKIQKDYNHNLVISNIVELNPYSPSNAINSARTNIVDKRLHEFYDELLKQNLFLTKEQIESEDFIHVYFETIKIVLNTRRYEKRCLFARLLSNYVQRKLFNNSDTYDEMLSILDDLSFREFQVLLILRSFEAKPLEKKQNILDRAISFWDNFFKTVEIEVGIPCDEIPGFLTRINRTSFYFIYANQPNKCYGFTTKNFESFLEAIKDYSPKNTQLHNNTFGE